MKKKKDYSKYYKKLRKKYHMKKRTNENYEIDETNLFASMILIYCTLALNIAISIYRMYQMKKQGTVLDRGVLSDIFLNKLYIVAILIFALIYMIPVYKKYLNNNGKEEFTKKIMLAYLPMLIILKIPSLGFIAYILWLTIHYNMFKLVSTTKNYFKILFALFICFAVAPYLFNNIFSIIGIIAAIVFAWVLFGTLGTSSYGGTYTSKPTNNVNSYNRANKNEPEVKEFKSDVKFYRSVGITGYKYIKQVNFWGNSEVCSQNDFDSGKVIIKQNGKQVTYVPEEPK